MLTKDPFKRINAAEALQHDWFSQIKSGKNLLFENKSLMDNLSKYYVNFIAYLERKQFNFKNRVIFNLY